MLTVWSVRTTYSPIIDSSAMMKPANSETSTMIEVQPGTVASDITPRSTR